jgi:pimeloyl-ACP methyl ester carboxylesterase
MLTFFLITVGVLLLPTVILGEIVYRASRSVEYDDLPLEQETVVTRDNVKINLWYSETTSQVAILVHGHGDHAGIMYERYAQIFTNLGYDLILIDMRNHGLSDDRPPITMGVEEHVDVVAVLHWAASKSWDKVLVFGTSMGSIASLLAVEYALEVTPGLNVVGIVLDSSFSDPIEVMNNNFEKNALIQPWRWMVVQYLTQLRASIDEFPDILDTLDQLAIPTLVIHGSADIEAPPSFLLDVDDLDNDYIVTKMVINGTHSRLFEQPEFVTALNDFGGGLA